MIPIANQPIAFPNFSTHNSLRICGLNEEKIPALKVGWNDPFYFQWKRETSENPVNCPIIEPNQGLEYIPDPELNETSFLFIPAPHFTIGSGDITHTTSYTDGLSYTMPIDSAKKYLVTVRLKDMGVDAQVNLYCGNVDPANGGADITADGEYTQELQRNVGAFDVIQFRFTNDVTIEYLSIKEKVTENSCWSFSGWQYNEDRLTHLPGETDPILLAMGSLTVGKTYKVIVHSKSSQGVAIVKSAFTNMGMLNSGESIFYFTPAYDAFSVIPSADYDGEITLIDIREIDVFAEGKVVLIRDNDDGFLIDLVDHITYQKDWATLIFTPSEYESSDIDKRCGYRLVFYTNGTHPIQYTSTVFEITDQLDCLQLMRAWCDCEGYDFNFEVFRLQKRIEFTWKVPTYEFDEKTQIKDNGYHQRMFSRRNKTWEVETTIDLCEVDHDNNSVMLHCDYLQVDGVHYFCDDKDYSTNADKDAKTVISAGRFTLSLLDDAIYNRNCGCGGEYLLRVINGWAEVGSYKRIDKFGFPFSLTIKVDSFTINGEEILQGSKSLTLFEFTDLILAKGINGNVFFGGDTFVQNVDMWLNELIVNYPIRFYDSLSVVNYQKGIDFKLKIATRTIGIDWDSDWEKYEYTNSGKKDLITNITHPYVA